MLRRSAFRIGILASAMLLTAAAQVQAREVEQQIAGACVNSASGESDCTVEGKGAPGKASYRVRQQAGVYGPASPQCDGFDFEASLLEGGGVSTFADGSQLYAVLGSGFSCASLSGAGRTVAEYLVVGGSGRFEGASGTLSVATENVSLSPAPGITALTGTVEGAITLP